MRTRSDACNLRSLGSLPTVAALIKAGRRLPWKRLVVAATWVYNNAKDNLTTAEWRELGTLLKKSKADPRKLNARERSRVRNLAQKGVTGKKPR
jgi:hypothetical protein